MVGLHLRMHATCLFTGSWSGVCACLLAVCWSRLSACSICSRRVRSAFTRSRRRFFSFALLRRQQQQCGTLVPRTMCVCTPLLCLRLLLSCLHAKLRGIC